ncbi:MAG: hypothetical protein RLN70_04035, partial [Rhodospirillaceae bacterium]
MAVRLAVAFFLGLIILLLAFYVIPGLTIWRSVMLPGMVVGFAGIIAVRSFAPRVLDMSAFKRRVLVIGTGDRAAMIEKLEDEPRSLGFMCCGYVEMPGETRAVREMNVVAQPNSLVDYINEKNISEIVVA